MMIKSIIGGLLLVCLPLVNAAQKNVLFIAIDDLNDWVGCMAGHPNALTPHIDSLADRGVLFTNAYCQAPLCGPSRASVLTGMLPTSTGIYLQGGLKVGQGSLKQKSVTLLPEYFKKHGYVTMAGGKIFHTIANHQKVFGEYASPTDMGPKPHKRFNFDPNWYKDKIGSTQTDWAAYPEKDAMMPDYKTASWAEKKLSQKFDKPFFMGVGFCRPHVPWYAPPQWFNKHPLEKIELPPYQKDDLKDVSPMALKLHQAPMMPTTDWAIENGQFRKIVQSYLACTTFVDAQVGRVLSALKKSPYAENTIIVLWSDHGYHLGEKNRFAKQSLWRKSTRVPLIIAAPGVNGNRQCGAPVGLIDLYPTLVKMAGLPQNPANEGRSLQPLLSDTDAQWDVVVPISYGRTNHALVSRDYYYIEYEDGSKELYNFKKDPHQWRNLAQQGGYEEQVKAFQKHLISKPAPLAKGSTYKSFNKYFKTREPGWKKP